MGWDWGHRDYGESVKEYLTENLTWDNERSTSRVLDMTIVKLHTAYAAVERIGKATGEREVWAYVGLLSYAPKSYYNQGKKDMEESSGPCEHECPERILDLLTPTDNEWANKWREECREYHAARKQKAKERRANPVQVGQRYDFSGAHLTVSGMKLDTGTIIGKTKRSWVLDTNAGRVRMSRKYLDLGKAVA